MRKFRKKLENSFAQNANQSSFLPLIFAIFLASRFKIYLQKDMLLNIDKTNGRRISSERFKSKRDKIVIISMFKLYK